MRFRTLGSTGIEVSEIGFGTWGIGGNTRGAVAYGATDDSQSVRALRCAYDRGINFFDTSDFYGYGHSETLLGDALGGVRDRIVIATKAGLVDAAGAQDFTPAHLRWSLEGSLRRLRTDYVDLFQLHSPPVSLLERDQQVAETLRELQREGKIRAYGVSARSPADALVAVRDGGYKCVQVNFNLVDERALEIGLFDLCAANGAGVIIRTPLCFGFLTGQYAAAAQFDPDDHRNRWSLEQRTKWANALGLFLNELRQRSRRTPSQLALQFCLSFAAVSTTIPGMLSEDHVRENSSAGNLGPMDDSELRGILQVYRQHDFYVEHRSTGG